MSELNIQLVREFFELNLFYALPHWRFEASRREVENSDSLLFVEQPNPALPGDVECLLHPGDVRTIQRAVVEVRAWHADRLYPSVIETNPIFARVASEQIRALAETVFNGREYRVILVVSEFSSAPARREQAVRALSAMGIDHIIEFPTMLADMLRLISPQDNYAPSQTLQTMRLLKRYGFLRLQQLELFFPAQTPDAPMTPPPDLETTFAEDLSQSEEDEM